MRHDTNECHVKLQNSFCNTLQVRGIMTAEDAPLIYNQFVKMSSTDVLWLVSCNILQHAATPSATLQHTTMCFNVLQHRLFCHDVEH